MVLWLPPAAPPSLPLFSLSLYAECTVAIYPSNYVNLSLLCVTYVIIYVQRVCVCVCLCAHAGTGTFEIKSRFS